jgi:GH35 family endo-1,4-beta-xylanase
MSRLTHATLFAVLAAALAAVALAASPLGPQPAHAAKGMEVAIQDDPALVAELSLKRKKALQLASQLHVTRIRVNLPWATIINKPNGKKRPKHRHYDFTSYDALWRAARKHGMLLQLTISGPAPAWATSDHKVDNHQINVDYFKEFVKTTAKHFKAAVDRYAIWNEPNWSTWNYPLKGNADRYRKMYLAAYGIIRKIDPSAKILIGETSPFGEPGRSTEPLKFLRQLTKPKGKLIADGYSHHPYDYTRSPYDPGKKNDNAAINTLGNLTTQLDKLAFKHKLTTPRGKPLNLFLTEYGFMASGKYKKPADKRAKFLTHAFDIALKNPRVKEMTQYLLAPPPPFMADFDTSIVTKKGKPTKPFTALKAWTTKEAKARMIALPFRHAAAAAR